MHNIKTSFDKILNVLKHKTNSIIPSCGNLFRPGPKPQFTDVEIIALSITADYLSLDSESHLFTILQHEYTDEFPDLISRRQYNDRKKSLYNLIEQVRKILAEDLNVKNEEDIYIIDSMPLEICKPSRMHRNKMGKGKNEIQPNRGYCASQKKHYYGYKLHVICNHLGVIISHEMTKASLHDLKYLKENVPSLTNCTLIGDMGYINKNFKEEIFEIHKIRLETPARKNQKIQSIFPWKLRKIRKKIETFFSQLCGQFMIQRNFAKGFKGYRTRILSKLSATTVLQYMNQFINNKPISKIKYSLKN